MNAGANGNAATADSPAAWTPKIAPGSDEEARYLAYLQIRERDWPRVEINPKHERWTYAQVPLWLLQREEVTEGAKLLYGRLLFYAAKNGRAYPNQGTLASDLGTNERQVRRFVKELVDHKLLDKPRRNEWGGSNCYVFLKHPWSDLFFSMTGMPAKRKDVPS